MKGYLRMVTYRHGVNNYRIGVFVYHFNHWKSSMGLLKLCLHGFKPFMVFAAPWKKLDVPKSPTRIVPDESAYHPDHICHFFDITYEIIPHDTDECENLIRSSHLDFGIVLGARILPTKIINAFEYGIINLHPGILPENRGLDNVKWAILKNIPQGVTAHWIDGAVDRGAFIKEIVVSYMEQDYSLMDIQILLRNVELKLMIDVLRDFSRTHIKKMDFGLLSNGDGVQSVISDEDDARLPELLKAYKERYPDDRQSTI